MRLRILFLILLLICSAPQAFAYPVMSCSDRLTFDHAPVRPVVSDTNMVQTVIDMGLTERFVGFGSVRRPLEEKVLKGPPDVLDYIEAHQIADRYPNIEALLGVNADFYYAGWSCGLTEASGVTPTVLSGFGVKTYVLNESCIRIGKRAPVSMETMYADIRALGEIFGVQDTAERMIAGFKLRVAAVTERTARAVKRPKVMYCGTCDSDQPALVIGIEGMPAALIDLAGGINVYPDIHDSYVRVGWETVIARNPDWLILSNTFATHEQVIRYLTTTPSLQNITAIRERQFIFMDYAERSPSTRNVEALERLARTLYPEFAP
jgi:iron complex transport system substrate-binding protein